MAYDYDVDILAALWTGAEALEEPYASFIAANPDLTDEVSENRILSTIELLRSHMEMLQNREEAKLLHESISKLFRHTAGGSNPWSDAAAVTSAVGNVQGPTFPAGASLDIIIDGVTYSPASASGGDCATVAAELNVTLDAVIPATAEITDITAGADSAGSLGGKYFTLNSAGDATAYYVWLNHAGVAERTTFTANADTGGDLGGTYFTLNSAGDATAYYAWMSHSGLAESMSLDFTSAPASGYPVGVVAAAWFDVTSTTATYRFWFSNGSTTPPATGGGETLVAIPFAGTETAIATAALVVTALVTTSADADFAGFVNGGTAIVTGTLATVGNVTDPADSTTGATIATTTQGVAVAVDPAPGGTAIPIIYAVGDTANTIAAALRSIIGALGDFGTAGGEAVCTVTNAAIGVTTDAADTGSTGFGIVIDADGLAVATDPAPGGLTAIPVPYAIDDTAATIGGAVATAVGGNADFGASGTTTVTITNAATGVTTDAADVDTGFGVSVTQQGSGGSGDAVPVQAFCEFPGPRLGIRGQEDFLTFELANGSGGIIGPAGIIPGTRLSTPARVADQGRNLSLNHFAGTRRNPNLTS